jgi:hypothetical protein
LSNWLLFKWSMILSKWLLSHCMVVLVVLLLPSYLFNR